MSLTFPTTPNNRLGLRLHSVSLARFSFRSTSQRRIATAEEQQHSSGSNWAVEWTRQAVTTNRAKCLPGQTTFFQQSNRTHFSCFFSAALAGIDGHWWWRRSLGMLRCSVNGHARRWRLSTGLPYGAHTFRLVRHFFRTVGRPICELLGIESCTAWSFTKIRRIKYSIQTLSMTISVQSTDCPFSLPARDEGRWSRSYYLAGLVLGQVPFLVPWLLLLQRLRSRCGGY